MSNTWRAFQSPLHEDKLGVTNNNKQDVSSFVLSSRQTPQKKKEPSFQGSGKTNDVPPSSKSQQQQYIAQNILKQAENSEFREQMDDIQNKVATLRKKMMSASPDNYSSNILPQNRQSSSNLVGCHQFVYQYPQSQSQVQQQQFILQKPTQFSHLQPPTSDRSLAGYNFCESDRTKQKKISILPNEYTQHSTTRSTSNKVGSSLVQKNSFLEDLENARMITNDNMNPFCVQESIETANANISNRPTNADIHFTQKEDQNETEMLKRCMMKIQLKLEKEKQKRRELKTIIKQSNQSIGSLRQDITNYQLDMQIVKQLTLNTTRAIENRPSSSTLRPSTTTSSSAAAAAQGNTVKKTISTSQAQKQMSKSKERLSNLVNTNVQPSKQKTIETLKLFGRRKSKSVSSTVMDFNQRNMLHINISSMESSDSSLDDELNQMKLQNNKMMQGNGHNNLPFQQPSHLKSEGETTTHKQTQVDRKSKSRLSQQQEVNSFSTELKQIQLQKKEKAQYYLSKLNKGKKPSLNLGDTNSSMTSSNMSALKFLQSNYQLQTQLKQKKTSKSTSKIINTSANANTNAKASAKQLPFLTTLTTDHLPTDANNFNYCASSQAQSIVSSTTATAKYTQHKGIIQQKLKEFKKFKEALNTEISELKKEFESNDPLLASLNFEKMKEKALKDKKVLLGLDDKNQQNTTRGSIEGTSALNRHMDDIQFHGDETNRDQDFQTPATHDRGGQSDVTQQLTNHKINQSHCNNNNNTINNNNNNNNNRTASKTTISESRETASFEKQRQFQSKNFSKDFLSPSEDLLAQQQNTSNNQQLGTGQFLSNMLMTESYTGEQYLNSDRKGIKKQNEQDKQKQDYKMFQNQLNYFKMQETLNKHLRQYESQILEKASNQNMLHQQQPNYQEQINSHHSQQPSNSSSAPSVKTNSSAKNNLAKNNNNNNNNNITEPISDNSYKSNSKAEPKQNNQNTEIQQNKQQQQVQIMNKQQQQVNVQGQQQNTTIQNNQTNLTNNSMQDNSGRKINQQTAGRQQIGNQSEKKGIEQYKKQLFPEGAEFSDEEYIQMNNQRFMNQEIELQKAQNGTNTVNIHDYSTNDSHQQYTHPIKDKQQTQSFSQPVVTQPRYIENQNEVIIKQIKKQQTEALLLNQFIQQNQQQYYTQNQQFQSNEQLQQQQQFSQNKQPQQNQQNQQLQQFQQNELQSQIMNQQQQQLSNQKIGSTSSHSIQTSASFSGGQPNLLFYKTPQNQPNQANSNSNVTSQYSSCSNSGPAKISSPQQQLQQEQFALFLQQSNSHLTQSGGGLTDRQYNKNSNSSEKMYPSVDTFTSPLMNLKSPDLNKSQLKKSGKSQVPSLPKSPNSVVNYYQDPINLSNITGVHSSNNSESLIYTASVGTTPAKSNFYSTPIQNQSINNTSTSNPFFYTNTSSSLQNNSSNNNVFSNNNNNNTNNNNSNNNIIIMNGSLQNNTIQQIPTQGSGGSNSLIFTKNNNNNNNNNKSCHSNQSSQNQAFLQNVIKDQPSEYITPQKK